MNSSVISQICGSQNGCFKETKNAKFSQKRTSFTPQYAQHMYVGVSGGKKGSLFGKFGVLCFLETLRPIGLLPTNLDVCKTKQMYDEQSQVKSVQVE